MPGTRKNGRKIEAQKKGAGAGRNEKRRAPKKLRAAIRTFVFSPTFNVAALVILLVSVFAGLRLFSARPNPAQVSFVERLEPDAPRSGNEGNRNYAAPEIFRGEVYDTTIRLRETGAIGMSISLAAFAEYTEKGSIPADTGAIWNSVTERGLMPPGVAFENGELISASSTFFVRYRAQPLEFEICARPKQDAKTDSPAVLLRFPLRSLDGRTITYFQSASVNRYEMPAPFAPLEKVVAAGWTLEQWRGELLPKNNNAATVLQEEKKLLNALEANR